MCASFAIAIASTALPVPRSSALRGRSRRTTVSIISRQPAVVPWWPVPKAKPCLDLDGEIAGAALVAVMRAVNQKPPGAHRLQAFQRLGDPVDVWQRLALDRGCDAKRRPARRAGGAATASASPSA